MIGLQKGSLGERVAFKLEFCKRTHRRFLRLFSFFFLFFQRDKELSESSKGGMTLTDSTASLICQVEGPLLLVFLGPFQRGRLGEGGQWGAGRRRDVVL